MGEMPTADARRPRNGEAGSSAMLKEALRNLVFLALMGSIAWVLVAADDRPDGEAPAFTGALCIHQPAEK